jgi:hypothetical protein
MPNLPPPSCHLPTTTHTHTRSPAWSQYLNSVHGSANAAQLLAEAAAAEAAAAAAMKIKEESGEAALGGGGCAGLSGLQPGTAGAESSSRAVPVNQAATDHMHTPHSHVASHHMHTPQACRTT